MDRTDEITAFVCELKTWINDDPFREAYLIAEVGIAPTSLQSLKGGYYKPSPRMVKSLRGAMLRHSNNSVRGGPVPVIA